MRHVLITGGAGFVGSHLAGRLLEDGVAVTIVDDLSTGSMENVSDLVGGDGFRLIVESVNDIDTMERLVADADFVFHLAAAVGVKLIVEQPVRTIQTNIKGTEVVLALANKYRTPVLLTSTSEVYGKNSAAPFAESDDMVLGPTTHSRWSYACSKAIDEFLALAYHRKTQLSVIVVRLFNTVGPRQTAQYGMVMPTLVGQALRGDPITVFGDGSQRRTFTYVTDAVEALLRLAVSPEARGEVFNVGGRREISIMDLAELVKQRTGSESPIVTIPYDEAYAPGFEDMARRVPDLSKVVRTVGFEPRVSLEEIIDNVVEHHRTHPDFR